MKKIFMLALALLLLGRMYATVWYVSPGATVNTGTSWATATSLNNALNQAVAGDQVWLSAGTYIPLAYPNGCTSCASSIDYTFLIPSGVEVYGGFNGTETALSQRDAAANRTILSGGGGRQHVVTMVYASSATLLDGVEVSGGQTAYSAFFTIYINGTSIAPDEGGGMYLAYSSPVIRNCYIVNNTGKFGAGVSAPFGDPVFQYCVIANNSAGNEAGGARLYNNGNFVGCTIAYNYAPTYGNIFFGAGNTLTLTNSIVWSGTIGSNNPPVSFYNVTYSTTPTAFSGTGNSITDPLFVDATDLNGPDNLWRTADDGLQLQCGSTARNTGNNAVSPPATDVLGTARILQTTIDKGAYELADMGGAILSGTRGVCAGATANLKVSITGGVPPFTVVINDGTSNQTITNYQSGADIAITGPAATKTYTLVSVTGRNACTASPLSGSATLTTLSSATNKVYVNDDATGLCDGSSWANAFSDLQYALESSCLATSTTVWVAGGTYQPSKFPAGCTNCTDFSLYNPYTHRTFSVPKNWQLYGSFAGTEATLADRTLAIRVANPSVITGANHPNGRVLHLMLVKSDLFPTVNSRVNGFIFEHAGTRGNYSDAVIGGTTFDGADGGGLYAVDGASIIEDCIFRQLTARRGGGVRLNGGNPVVQRCVFEADTVSGDGGALFAQQTSSLLLQSCVFVHNQANYFGGGGGAIHLTSGGTTVSNCTFYQNTAYGSSPTQLTAKGAAIYMDYQVGGKIRNSILWENTTADPTDAGEEEIWREGQAITTLRNTTIRDSLPMTWVFDSLNNDYGNPQFLNPSDPDGPDNLWFTADDGLQLAPGSPCINTGTNVTLSQSLDMFGLPRIAQTVADRGAYEFTGLSSATLGGNTNVCPSSFPFLTVNIVGGKAPYFVHYSDGFNSVVVQNYQSGDSIFVTGSAGTVYSILSVADSLGQSLSTISGTKTVTYKSTTRVYVAQGASGDSTGQTWTDAFTDLQDAFDYECMADGLEIWVAEGIYKPSLDPVGSPNVLNAATRTFLIPNRVRVLGGFAGTETSLSQRTDSSMVLHPTVLSGANVGTPGSNYPDAFHVVMLFEADSTTLLDGFTITKGKAYGLGIFPYLGTGWFGTWGGGMYIKRGNPVISRCLVLANTSYGAGGGIALDTTAATFEGCVFFQNTTQGSGGVATIQGGAPSFLNCVMTGNIAGNGGTLTANGGVINAYNGANIHLGTCTVTGNDAAGASSKGGGCYIDGASLQVSNSIFWNNTLSANFSTANSNRKEIYNNSSNQPAVVVSYSLIKDVFPITDVTDGGGNTSSAPNFVDATNPAGADTLWRTADDGLALGCSSPALNVGSNALNTTLNDLTGNARVNGSAIDMGAYEQGGAASSAGTAQITTQFSNPLCAGATTNVQLALTGAAGPYTVTYAANGSTYTVNNISGTSGISFSPTGNDTLELVSVQAANGCLLDLIPGGAAYTTYPIFNHATLSLPQQVCAGSGGSMSVTAIGGTSPYTVVWTGGTITNYVSPSPVSFTPSSAIQYTLSSVTDANGCAALALFGSPASVAVVSGPAQAVISGNATSCQGSAATLNLTVTGGAPPYSVVYAGGGGGTLPAYTGVGGFQVTPTATTSYTLVSVTDANGCSASNVSGTATVSVSTAPPPSAASIQVPAGVCAGGTANLVVTVTGGTPPYSVVYPGGVFQNYTSGTPIPVSPTTATTYTITGVIDANGCGTSNVSGGGLMQIYPNPANATLSGIDTVCVGDAGQVSLVINGGTPPFTVVHSGGTLQNYTPSVFTQTPTAPTTYSLVSVTDANGCVAQSLSGSATMVPVPAPVAGFTSAVQPARVVQFTNTSTNITSQAWIFGDPASGTLNLSTQASPSHIYSTTGTFTVILMGMGCKADTLTQTVNVINVGVEAGLQGDLSLYPNPAGGQVSLLLQHPSLGSVEATLTDVTGKMVLRQTLSVGAVEVLNMSQLSAGVYLLSLRDGDTLLQTVRVVHE